MGAIKLIINEQDITVRTCKKVEHNPSKFNGNKGRAWRSPQRHDHKVQRDYFWFRYPCLYGVLRYASKAADHWSKNIWSKADGRYDEETRMGETSKKYCNGGWHDDWEEKSWGTES